jgi:nitroreductase
MEVFDAVRTVLAIRDYKKIPVPQESVRRIVEAGRLTGSAMNGQPIQSMMLSGQPFK